MKDVKIWFAGAEVSAHRKVLVQEHVQHVALNYHFLNDSLRGAPFALDLNFEQGQEVLVDSGAYSIEKAEEFKPSMVDYFFEEYVFFVTSNLDSLRYVVEADFMSMGLDWIEGQRFMFWDDLDPEKVIFVWHPEWGVPMLRSMLKKYKNIGIPKLSVKAMKSQVATMVKNAPNNIFGLSVSPYAMPSSFYNNIVSSAWISPEKYGETHIWDGQRLHRYPADQQAAIRKQHRNTFINAGFDADMISIGSSREIKRYTIFAWLAAEAKMQGPIKKAATNGHVPDSTKAVTRSVVLDTPAIAPQANGRVTVIPPETPVFVLPALGTGEPEVVTHLEVPEGKKLMPGFEIRVVHDDAPDPTDEEPNRTKKVARQVTGVASVSARQCKTCAIQQTCPEFEEESVCKFVLPVSITTRAEMLAVLKTVIEVQYQRVGFARMSETASGEVINPAVSDEFKVLFNLVAKMKEIEDNRDSLKFNIEAKGIGAPGVLTSIFGAKATAPINAVDPRLADQALARAFGGG